VRLLVGVVAVLVILSQSLAIVPEDKQALILRFGEIERTVNRYKEGEDFGKSGAGLVLRVPFTDGIQYIDKRILGVNMERQQVLSTDQQRLQVDAFARFRITNPVRMYTAIRTEDKLQTQLATILGSSLRNELGKRTFATLLSPERGAVMDNIQVALNREAKKYGAEIIDVGSSAPTCPKARRSRRRTTACAPRVSRKRSRSVPKARRKRRSSAAAPMAKPRAYMPQASAKTPTSMISIARCRAIGRPSSVRTTRAGRRSSCRPTMNI
jgi:hypothetical protein